MEEIVKCTQSSSGTIQNWITLGMTIAGPFIGTLLGAWFSYKIALKSVQKQFENQEKWDRNRRESDIKQKEEYICQDCGDVTKVPFTCKSTLYMQK